MQIKIKTEDSIELPSIPNFIKMKSGELRSIKDFTEEQLKKIVREWGFFLLKKAKYYPSRAADIKLVSDIKKSKKKNETTRSS